MLVDLVFQLCSQKAKEVFATSKQSGARRIIDLGLRSIEALESILLARLITSIVGLKETSVEKLEVGVEVGVQFGLRKVANDVEDVD